MQDFILKAAAVALVAVCLGGLVKGLEKENARLGAVEMCDPGWNAHGRKSGVFYGVVHEDVLEYYRRGLEEEEVEEEPTLEFLIRFCKQIGFNPEK